MGITVRTIRSRFLLRPSEELNQTVAGVLAKALDSHQVKLHAVIFLSTHFHLLISPDSVKEMADFMRFVNRNLSGEVGKLPDWSGSMWSRRYTSIPVSDETAAQISRRKYLDPLPCWDHLDEKDWRGHVVDIVEQIETETLDMHRRAGTAPKGATAATRVHPHERPVFENRSPKPLFQALAGEVRDRMREAYSAFVAAYADASERLRMGNPRPRFPPDCFPPALPFVRPLEVTAFGFT